MARFLICTVGSAGDVYPFIAISQTLLARGHEVQMLTSPRFRAPVERAGIGFVALGSEADYERLVQLPDLWHPSRGLELILRELLDRLDEATSATERLVRPSETVLVGSTLAWNVRLVQERLRVPAATVHLSPSCLASATLPPVLPGIGELSWLPVWAVKLLQSASERLLIDPRIAPKLNRLRASLGLPPVRRVLGRWMHSPELVICAWPEWFAPTQPDWPEHAVTTGFALLREAQPSRLDPALTDFLDAGPAPIGLTPGSAMAHGKLFFARGLQACASIGRRAIVVTPYADQLPQPLPEWAHHASYAPFDALLPRLAALVHHGGIGTCAEALAAGAPQVVVPFAHDQFDNAARLGRLRLGVSLRVSAPVDRWVRALKHAQTDEALATAGAAAQRMRHTTRSAEQIADRLERLCRGK